MKYLIQLPPPFPHFWSEYLVLKIGTCTWIMRDAEPITPPPIGIWCLTKSLFIYIWFFGFVLKGCVFYGKGVVRTKISWRAPVFCSCYVLLVKIYIFLFFIFIFFIHFLFFFWGGSVPKTMLHVWSITNCRQTHKI